MRCTRALLASLLGCVPVGSDELPITLPAIDDDDDDGEPAKFDTLPEIDAGARQCLECSLSVASRQSGVFAVTGADLLATAELAGEVVYALGTHGQGRFIAAADSALPFNELTDCPLHAWLIGRPGPATILRFGWTEFDGPIDFDLDALGLEQTVAGVHLPPQYVGDPGRLAEDFDLVLYLESSAQFGADAPSDAELETLLDYVADYGKGLYVASEFADPIRQVYLGADDLDSVNRLLRPLGLEALARNLEWGDVHGTVEFACFPMPVG